MIIKEIPVKMFFTGVLRNSFVGVFFLLGTFSIAQERDYTPMNYQSTEENLIIEHLQKNLAQSLTRLANHSHREEIIPIYEQRTNTLIEKVKNNHFIFDVPIYDQLQAIFKQILTSNPELKEKKPFLFISRNIWPNAYCLGEGSIVINIGLLRHLENESQIAFVLCHELAHLEEDHANLSIHEHIEDWNQLLESDQFKRLKKQKYNRSESFQRLVKNLNFDHKRHSRTHEAAADALGMSFFLNTKYDPKAAISCLEILDHIDEEKQPASIALEVVFNTPNYPFKKKWTKPKKQGLRAMKRDQPEEAVLDSLKTHPDCQRRIELLYEKFPTIQQVKQEDEKSISNYRSDAPQFDFEIIQACYDFDQLGLSLYYSLKLLEQYPDHVYLRAMIGKSLYSIYQASKEHRLDEYLPLPSSHQTVAYRKLLRFIHNLRLDELKKINYHFLETRKEQFAKEEEYLLALILSNSAMENQAATKRYIEAYQTQFPTGKYTLLISLL